MIRKFETADEKWVRMAKAKNAEIDEIALADKWIVEDEHGTASGIILTIDRPEQDAVEPHVQWFPWVRGRDIVTGFIEAMEFFTKTKNVVIVTRQKYVDFYDGMTRRGHLRKVGFLEKMPCGGEVHIYQAVKVC